CLFPPRLHSIPLHDALPISREALKLWRALAEHHAGDHAAALADWTRRSAEEAPSRRPRPALTAAPASWPDAAPAAGGTDAVFLRSEEHTSELQSRENLVCRL